MYGVPSMTNRSGAWKNWNFFNSHDIDILTHTDFGPPAPAPAAAALSQIQNCEFQSWQHTTLSSSSSPAPKEILRTSLALFAFAAAVRSSVYCLANR